MIDRTAKRFGLMAQTLVGDNAYSSAANVAWMVKQRGNDPHIPVFDKSTRTDGTFSRAVFVFNAAEDRYTCLGGKQLVKFRRTERRRASASPRRGRGFTGVNKCDCQD